MLCRVPSKGWGKKRKSPKGTFLFVWLFQENYEHQYDGRRYSCLAFLFSHVKETDLCLKHSFLGINKV